jgi:hypothetical protein
VAAEAAAPVAAARIEIKEEEPLINLLGALCPDQMEFPEFLHMWEWDIRVLDLQDGVIR